MTEKTPRFVFETIPNPGTGGRLRLAMCGSALFIAFMAFMLPTYLGVDEPFITIALLIVAVTDFVMGFVMPALIEKYGRNTYSFFDDHAVIKTGGAEYRLTYENISAVEEYTPKRGQQEQFASVRLVLREKVAIPFLADATGVILSSLPAYEHPAAKIKEVVEKSRIS